VAQFWGDKLTQHDSSMIVVYVLEPFASDFLTHGRPSAYPPDRSHAVFPSNIYFGWTDESVDNVMANAMHASATTLIEAEIKDGQDLASATAYVNYALFGTPLERIYGDNLERLREIRGKYDPQDVMGLTGGWKFEGTSKCEWFKLHVSHQFGALKDI
jgi:hypothetical protein